jgi:dienelactone hydrolase
LVEKEVSFKTEDGRRLRGMMSKPKGAARSVPAVVFLHSFEHDRDVFGYYIYPGLAEIVAARGVATLRFDLRGRGQSMGDKELHWFSPEEVSRLSLDVKAGLSFLGKQRGVDGTRLGIVAEQQSADAALMGWGGDHRVSCMALISGRLSDAAKNQIAASPKLPLLLVVSSEDKKGFADATDAYFLSTSRETDIEVYEGLGIGAAMFSAFQDKSPKEVPLQRRVADWVADQILLEGELTEVSFQTDDGWTIYGNLRVPQGVAERVPAVLLLHTSLSDRHVYHDLEIALAKKGLAVLNIDWRGKGKSTGKGRYSELSEQEHARSHLDVFAAVNFLATQPDIDATRIGVLGAALGTRHAMAAAVDEPRIKTAVLLTGYYPTEREKNYLISRKLPVFYIITSNVEPFAREVTELYNLTRQEGSELLVYEGGGIGYQFFRLDNNLVPRIARWMSEKLNRFKSCAGI